MIEDLVFLDFSFGNWGMNIPKKIISSIDLTGKKKIAGQDWYVAFIKANGLSLRTPEERYP